MTLSMPTSGSASSTPDGGLYDEALMTFFVEAREMLQQIEASLLLLETSPDDRDTINALFRAAHTIKGSAGLFGLDRIVGFTHQVESVLDTVRRGARVVDHPLSDALLKSVDVLLAMLAQAEQRIDSFDDLFALDAQAQAVSHLLGQPSASAESQMNLSQSIKEVSMISPPRASAGGVWHLSLRFAAQAMRNGFDPISVMHYLGTIGTIEKLIVVDDALPGLHEMDAELCYLGFEISLETNADRAVIDGAFDFVRDDCTVQIIPPAQHPLPSEVIESGLGKQSKQAERKVDEARFIRVHADKLDALINQVGELVICGASASLQAQNSRQPQMLETTQRMSGLVEEIRNGALALRMVEIGETFNRYRRVVRDTAAELGKQITLEIEGADTELDKSVIEKIGDPLMHLVRNAIDHGIEAPDKRVAAGKAAHGTVSLSAHHDSGYIVLQVRDDGKGLDGEMLLHKARERGLVGVSQSLSENEKLNLIFEPGFSTAETITNLSGRGVGMDVVKKNIEALRGTVLIKSTVGQGTTIEIRLPLTLAIIDGFLVRVGDSSYVIPLHAVVECIDAHADLLHASDHWAGHIDVRGELLPYLELRAIFKVAEDSPTRRSIVVVKNHDTTAGLVVDQLLGEYQTVIKPLGRLFQQLRGISGSTVLGSGEVALILDVPALVLLATEHGEQAVKIRA